MTIRTIALTEPTATITLELEKGVGTITSAMAADDDSSTRMERLALDRYNTATKGVEALLLGLAMSGVDVSASHIRDAVQCALDAISDEGNFGVGLRASWGSPIA